MTKGSDNVFPRFLISEGGSTATPAAGRVTVYAKADGLLYSKDDAGVETLVSGGAGGGSVATDAIWDAAGDLALGSGANTAARLAISATAGHLLKSNGTTAAWAYPTFTGWLVQRTTDQTGIVTATDTAVVFNGTDVTDTHAFHDPGSNPSRCTIPAAQAGYYRLSAYVIWDNASATGRRQLWFFKNGTPVNGGNGLTINGSTTFYEQLRVVSDPIALASTDYVEVMVHQTSGADRVLSGSIVALTFGGEFLGV